MWLEAQHVKAEAERGTKRAANDDGTGKEKKTRTTDASGSGLTEAERTTQRKRTREEEEEGMEVSAMEEFKIEHNLQDDMRWEINEVSDMCEPSLESTMDITYDEVTWEKLDPSLVKAAEEEEMARFAKMGVYKHVSRTEAEKDPTGKFVKVKWIRINKGTATEPKVRCRLVAQELGYGVKDDELFAGTPSMTAVKFILAKMANNRRKGKEMMILDVKSAFLYGKMKRNVYIELPTQDRYSMYPDMVGHLEKAMYGTRDAPLIWQEEVRRVMGELGFEASMHQPAVYHHPGRDMDVVVHVDDFLCTGSDPDLKWLFEELKKSFELTATRVGPNHEHEVKYLNRTIRWGTEGLEWEGDVKHSEILVREWGMQDCKTMDIPMTKDVADKLGDGKEADEEGARRIRRGIARVNYMAQDRPDLSVSSRLLSQRMAKPTAGTEVALKRLIRYIRSHPRGRTLMKWDSGGDLHVLTDSDWAGNKESRKSTSGGCLVVGSTVISHWSKLQSNIALSSGEAELNAAVKGISELIGVSELRRELGGAENKLEILTDASACKGMLLRRGAGRVKHLVTKQLWVQGAIECQGIRVLKIPRDDNFADMLTHLVSREVLSKFLADMNFSTSM